MSPAVTVTSEEFDNLKAMDECEQRTAEAIGEVVLIREMFKCYARLKRLGWNDATYAPKGPKLEVIEAGSTGIHQATRDNVCFWVHDDVDSWPSHPVLYRLKEPRQ